MKLYEYDGEYLAVGDKSPKGLEGVVFVAHQGPDPSAMKETVIPVTELKKLAEIEPPDTWREYLGLKPKAKPPSVKPPVEIVVAEVVEEPIRVPHCSMLPTLWEPLAFIILGALAFYFLFV